MIYLDNSAGTRPYTEVIETITNILTNHWGNASSDHSFGQDAKTIIDIVTEQVAADINCSPDNIIWTSGACEANSLAIDGFIKYRPFDNLIFMSRLEHTSMRELYKNFNYCDRNRLYFLENDKNGFVFMDEVVRALKNTKSCNRVLVTISFANSEIGSIQDIKTISSIVHKYGGILHVDSTQVYPWQRIDVQELGIDMMSVSGQKMHCCKGVGFLYVKDGIDLKPIIYGSQQEARRGGTYPTHLIAAFGKALQITRERNAAEKVCALREKLMDSMQHIDGTTFKGPSTYTYRLPHIISATIKGVSAEQVVAMCDNHGIMISKGSACQSYSQVPSKTLLAIGLTQEEALSTIRISLDEFNTESEINYVCEILPKIIVRLRQIA
jgi:cysteine desulfurase